VIARAIALIAWHRCRAAWLAYLIAAAIIVALS
jgi:hypothetical protein